ncbi:Hypothetical predicted protein [Mytilus galloprovincialis]|uniref:Uncharacterized protein n=1 Tax=Mytilus galloprovincialis TaxID=29158 RepID=A0A8B6C588_MYTGA|nr:Hypothetical predicted protein [Mytilus galloprovincialis]
MMENTPYCKKVSALEKEFSDFLSKNAKSIVFATPEEVRKFLIVKDCKGKTQVHEIICPNLGDRASDLGKCLSQEITDDSGFVITHTVGKTLSNGKKNEFSVMRLDDHSVCPVFGIEKYVSGAGEMGINLTLGYLFRILDCSRKRVLEAPVSHSVMYGRLKSYLRELGMDEGETPHGIRGGCAVTLAVSGFGNSQDIMDHVGWFSRGQKAMTKRTQIMSPSIHMGTIDMQTDGPQRFASYERYQKIDDDRKTAAVALQEMSLNVPPTPESLLSFSLHISSNYWKDLEESCGIKGERESHKGGSENQRQFRTGVPALTVGRCQLRRREGGDQV